MVPVKPVVCRQSQESEEVTAFPPVVFKWCPGSGLFISSASLCEFCEMDGFDTNSP